jgi:type VI protein secretion system component VasK
VQTIEDVLAQTTASREDGSRPRAALAWQRDLAAACRAALTGRYPFAADGADANLATVRAFLGPDGALARFYTGELASILDTSGVPWTWKPEARLAGFTPESAAFFERAVAVGDALFPTPGGVDLTLAALAQRGVATISLGGETAPIQATGEVSGLAWPGPFPDLGFAIAFSGGGEGARQNWAGTWGLLRFLDTLHLRARDDGRRFLIDVRLTDTRAYLELGFARRSNPVAARALMSGMTCPTL